jgi:anti-sigma B factor antagonist
LPIRPVVPFRCEVEPERESVRVRPRGELDIATVHRVDDRLRELRDAGFSRLVLDLSGLTFMDATGVRLLADWSRAAISDGHEFLVAPGGEQVEDALRITGLREQLRFVVR